MSGKQIEPNKEYPVSSTTVPSPMPLIIPDPSIRGASFDQLLENRGIRFIHRRAAPCPNIKSLDDNSHDPLCSICDGNGILYYGDKEIWGTLLSNSLQKNFEQQGIWEIGTAVVTFPTEYPDGTQAEFQTYDQLVVEDFTIRMWELKEYEPRVNNQQRLRYPIVNSDFFACAKGGSLVELIEDTDFSIVDGNIEWINALSYDSVTERGEVFVANYFANPVYVVLQHMRELRITQELQADGTKISKRLPQQLLVKRDFLANLPETEA